MTLVQIVPRLPPSISGLGDYALSLARRLSSGFGIRTHFIVGDDSWRGEESIEGFSVSRMTMRSAGALCFELESVAGVDTILLHYVGYGYARRGCPCWLIAGLRQWRRGAAGASRPRLVTMFHETFAGGSPLTSAFWLSPAQKRLVTLLARWSDHCVTNTESSATLLERLSCDRHKTVQILPVFSNVGELKRPLPLINRPRKMVVFGTSGRRIEVYKRSQALVNQLCRQFEIDEIFDVGSPISRDGFDALCVRVTPLGELPGAEISELLSKALIGLLDYPETLLGKSGIFASYCAHGLLPVIATYGPARQADGLEAGKHYRPSRFGTEDLSLACAQTIADNAFSWYQTHNLDRHSELFASFLTVTGEMLIA
jgi:hypothetical protein